MSNPLSLRDLGPVDEWLIPAADIEVVMLTGRCHHGKPMIDACRTCFVDALFRRQMEILAERLGCSAEDAKDVAHALIRKHQEHRP